MTVKCRLASMCNETRDCGRLFSSWTMETDSFWAFLLVRSERLTQQVDNTTKKMNSEMWGIGAETAHPSQSPVFRAGCGHCVMRAGLKYGTLGESSGPWEVPGTQLAWNRFWVPWDFSCEIKDRSSSKGNLGPNARKSVKWEGGRCYTGAGKMLGLLQGPWLKSVHWWDIQTDITQDHGNSCEWVFLSP